MSTLNALFRLAFAILAISLFVGGLQHVEAADALIKPSVFTNTSYETATKTIVKTSTETETKIKTHLTTDYETDVKTIVNIYSVYPVNPSTPSKFNKDSTTSPTSKQDNAITSDTPVESPSSPSTSATTPTTAPPVTSPPKKTRQGYWASINSVKGLSSRLKDAAAGKIILTPQDIAAEATREEQWRLQKIKDEEENVKAAALAEAWKEQSWEEYIRGEDPFISREKRVAKAKKDAQEKVAREKKETEEKAAREKREAEEKVARKKAATESSSSSSSSRSVASEKSASSQASVYAESMSKKNAKLSSIAEAAFSSSSSSSVSSVSAAASRAAEEAAEIPRIIEENLARGRRLNSEREAAKKREEEVSNTLAVDREYFEEVVSKYEKEVEEKIAQKLARQKAKEDKMDALKKAYEEEQREAAAKRLQEETSEAWQKWRSDLTSEFKASLYGIFGNTIMRIISWIWEIISTVVSFISSFPLRVFNFIVDFYQYIQDLFSGSSLFNLPALPFSQPSLDLDSLSETVDSEPYNGTAPTADIIMPSCGGSVILATLAVASLFVITITAHFAIQYVKSIAPGPFGVASTVLMYQPVFWSIVFSLGYLILFPFGWLINQLLFQWQHNRFFFFFVMLASFKAFKGFVHIFSYYFWTNPAQPPLSPSVTPRDVTVIVATVGDFGPDFQKTIQTILVNQPRQFIIATVGVSKANSANQAIADLPRALVGSTSVSVDQTMVPNKRSQFISAASNAEGSIICYADDHVIWPTTFLRSALAPFEDAGVGMVGTVKAVERVRDKGLLVNFLNYIGCIYLERHNFECTATYNIDGGVFVISGRTGLIRKAILERLDFRTGFLNEYFNFGPLHSTLMKPDDDNFMTRYCVKNGWKTVFHNHPDACIGTSIGVDKDGSGSYLNKISGQLARWARTTWRSNLVSLFVDRVCWQQYPWTTYAMFISSFVNLAIIYDPLMLLFLYLSRPQVSFVCGAVTLLALSKCVKPLGFIWKNPSDIFWLPIGVLFGYFHSFIRLYALFTVTNVEWSGRVLTRPSL